MTLYMLGICNGICYKRQLYVTVCGGVSERLGKFPSHKQGTLQFPNNQYEQLLCQLILFNLTLLVSRNVCATLYSIYEKFDIYRLK